MLKLFFAFSWVNVVPACVLRLELSILIANFQVADRMLSHLGSPPYVSDSARQALPKSHILSGRIYRQSIQAAILRSRRTASMHVCNAASMFFLASSKLLPLTVTDSSAQAPFHPPHQDAKAVLATVSQLAPHNRSGTVINLYRGPLKPYSHNAN